MKIILSLILLFSGYISAMESDESIAKKALSVEISAVKEGESKEVAAMCDQSFAQVEKGNYDKALSIATQGLEAYPTDFDMQTYFAMILGDSAGNFSIDLKEKMEKRSKEMFEALVLVIDKKDRRTYYWFLNEYCYRCSNYKRQYELGVQRVNEFWGTKNWNSSGYYSQGVGAANYARELLFKGEKELARDYAQKAVIAWAQYFTLKNTYYNAYVHYAIALAILGSKDEAEKALKRGTEIIQKDHREFQEVREFMSKASELGLI